MIIILLVVVALLLIWAVLNQIGTARIIAQNEAGYLKDQEGLKGALKTIIEEQKKITDAVTTSLTAINENTIELSHSVDSINETMNTNGKNTVKALVSNNSVIAQIARHFGIRLIEDIHNN